MGKVRDGCCYPNANWPTGYLEYMYRCSYSFLMLWPKEGKHIEIISGKQWEKMEDGKWTYITKKWKHDTSRSDNRWKENRENTKGQKVEQKLRAESFSRREQLCCKSLCATCPWSLILKPSQTLRMTQPGPLYCSDSLLL